MLSTKEYIKVLENLVEALSLTLDVADAYIEAIPKYGTIGSYAEKDNYYETLLRLKKMLYLMETYNNDKHD